MHTLRPMWLLLVAFLCLGAAKPAPEAEARTRLTRIIDSMAEVRFCQSNRCKFRSIYWQVKKSTTAGQPYEGLIRAEIVRPSNTVDKARYEFDFIDNRWQLMSGTETTDVNDTTYVADTYEVNSVYGRTPVKGKLSSSDLQTGYRMLYERILNQGKEKI